MELDISSENIEAIKKWHGISQLLKKKKSYQCTVLHSMRISFRNEGEKIKIFLGDGKLKEFDASGHTLKEWLKEVL